MESVSIKFYCKYCNKECKNRNSLAQHEIRCKENPSSIKINNNFLVYNNKLKNGEMSPWNKGLNKETSESINKQIRTYKENHSKNLHKDSNLWQKDKEKQEIANRKRREKALQNHLGWKNTGKVIEYNGIKLNSSYELKVAKSLDENRIRWERPGGISYIDNNNVLHNYIPDFYLIDYDIYLEPKNKYLIENINKYLGFTDIEKLKFVANQNNVKIILLTSSELDWNTIKNKINNNDFIK